MLDCENNYEAKSLATIAENLDRRRVPITKSDRIAGDVPYYGASGVVDHVEGYLFDEELLLISEDGANLLARTYPIAFSISGKTWVNNHAHILRFADRNEQEFVSLYLNSISLVPFVSGMAQPKLNQQEMNKIPVPLPDPATCEQIVAKAGAIGAESVQLQTHYRAKLADLDDLRQALLQKAFAGQLC
jgi:type I restriction enzyme S subunit